MPSNGLLRQYEANKRSRPPASSSGAANDNDLAAKLLKLSSGSMLGSMHTLASSFSADKQNESEIFAVSADQIVIIDWEGGATKACVIYWNGTTLSSAVTTISATSCIRHRQNPANPRQFVSLGGSVHLVTVTANSTAITISSVAPTSGAGLNQMNNLVDVVFNAAGTALVLCEYDARELFTISGTTLTKVASSYIAWTSALNNFSGRTTSRAELINSATNEAVFAVYGVPSGGFSQIQAVRFTFTTSAVTVTENNNAISGLVEPTYNPSPISSTPKFNSRVRVFGGVFTFMHIINGASGFYGTEGINFNANTSFSAAGGSSFKFTTGTTGVGMTDAVKDAVIFPMMQEKGALNIGAYARKTGSGYGNASSTNDSAGVFLQIAGHFVAGRSLFTPTNSTFAFGAVSTDNSLYFIISGGSTASEVRVYTLA